MAREQRLAHVFVTLADTLVADFDMVELLHTLTEASVELLDVDAAGLMLSDQRGGLRRITSTGEPVRVLELFELQQDEGPCPDCFRTGAPILNVDLRRAGGRWPTFAATAVDAGFNFVHALPLRLRHEVIGAMNLFSGHATPLTDDAAATGQALADVATIGLLQERAIRDRQALAEQLQTALNSRILIEQAKGILAERAGFSLGEAFTAMRAHARRNNQKLSAVATGILDGSIGAAALSVVGCPDTGRRTASERARRSVP